MTKLRSIIEEIQSIGNRQDIADWRKRALAELEKLEAVARASEFSLNRIKEIRKTGDPMVAGVLTGFTYKISEALAALKELEK